jgi:NAD(P)-dependent dehydrogenase (short-subunit alcohol dehydrogenase family)
MLGVRGQWTWQCRLSSALARAQQQVPDSMTIRNSDTSDLVPSQHVAIITGGARGLGRACVERFLNDRATVVAVDIDEAGLADLGSKFDNSAKYLRTVIADVSKRADIDRAVDIAVQEFGRLDVMINNAGIVRSQDFLTITEDNFDQVLGVNLKGPFLGVQAAARTMIAGGNGGVIINMSSINAILGNPSIATYAISKGGLNQLTVTAALALAPHGIRVVGIGPGTILTDMVAKSIMTSDEARHSILSRTPMGRCGDPSEIASVAAFLASKDASYITGQTIYPDGGRLILNYTVPVAS